MKIIQISDTHLMPCKNDLNGLNPTKNLESCIESINKFHADSEFCIITGDLTDRGDFEAYNDLRKILQKLKIPFYPIIGNHDQREIFLEVFPEVQIDEYGFIQRSIRIPLGNILLLDTVEQGKDWGSFCKKRETWLRKQLKNTGDKSVYLFMHHPPFKIRIPALDRINIKKDSIRFQKIINEFSNIKHIFFGHVHRPITGSWFGIPFNAIPSTNHQIQLDLDERLYLSYNHEPTAYSVILLEPQQTTVHFFNYQDDSFYKKMI